MNQGALGGGCHLPDSCRSPGAHTNCVSKWHRPDTSRWHVHLVTKTLRHLLAVGPRPVPTFPASCGPLAPPLTALACVRVLDRATLPLAPRLVHGTFSERAFPNTSPLHPGPASPSIVSSLVTVCLSSTALKTVHTCMLYFYTSARKVCLSQWQDSYMLC